MPFFCFLCVFCQSERFRTGVMHYWTCGAGRFETWLPTETHYAANCRRDCRWLAQMRTRIRPVPCNPAIDARRFTLSTTLVATTTKGGFRWAPCEAIRRFIPSLEAAIKHRSNERPPGFCAPSIEVLARR